MANTDDLKGRAKQAAGDITGDSSLKREGKIDQLAGKAKEFVSGAADKAKEAESRVKDAAESLRG